MSNDTIRTWWNGNMCHMEHFESSTVVGYSQHGLTRAHIERLCEAKLMRVVGDVEHAPKPKQLYTKMEAKLIDAIKNIAIMCADDSSYKDILLYCREVLK